MDELAPILLAVAKFFFVFSLTIFILSIIMPPPSKDGKPKPKERIKGCPPHVWRYDKDGQMYCAECPRKPGQ